MSVRTVDGVSFEDASTYHWLAVGATCVLIWSYLSVFHTITNIVGGSDTLFWVVGGSLIAATALARKLPAWTAFVLGACLLGIGLFGYLVTVPGARLAMSHTGMIIADNVALLTGLSVLRMSEVGTWALGVAPATVFVPWYLVFRRQYVLAAGTGGLALGFFVLTGDVGSFVTLVGVLGALGVVAFGTMARHGGSVAQLDVLAVALVAMVLLSTTVSVVPGGTASPLLPSGSAGSSGGAGGLVANGQHVAIQGSIELSPKVQYTVEANRETYWRIGAYDRYSGESWHRSEGNRAYSDQSHPPGDSYEVRQTVEVEAGSVEAMPAAWKPIRLIGDARKNARISSTGGLVPSEALTKGQRYSVVSRVPEKRPTQLRNAGTDYPDGLRERYTQLPESTSDRLYDKSGEIVGNADNPYDKATAIETWLEENKAYSLDVQRPDGSVAESFVFEMDEGYCVYYATAMVAMLRTQGVPARFVTGYGPGQRVSEDEWVVRGLDSHAWVEVYFPDVGWVRFDPTPSSPRTDARQSMVDEARSNGVDGVDTDASTDGTWTPEPTTTTTATTTTDGNGTTSSGTSGRTGPDPQLPNEPQGGSGGSDTLTTTNTTTTDDGGTIPINPPSEKQLLYAGLLSVGVLLTARRTGAAERAYRALWLRWQPRDDPGTDVRRAFDRLEYYLGREHRPRRPGETPREYLESLPSVDDRVRRVGALYERARYAGAVDDEHADEAVSLVDDIVRGASAGDEGRK